MAGYLYYQTAEQGSLSENQASVIPDSRKRRAQEEPRLLQTPAHSRQVREPKEELASDLLSCFGDVPELLHHTHRVIVVPALHYLAL